MLQPDELHQAMADYVAGDLSQHEAQEFEAYMAEHAEECAVERVFWEQALPMLGTHGRPQAEQSAADDFAASIRARLAQSAPANMNSSIPAEAVAVNMDSVNRSPARERIRQPNIAFPHWLRYVVSAAAASILTVIAFMAGHFQAAQVETKPEVVAETHIQIQNINDKEIAYNEHGAAVTVPHKGGVVNAASYLQYHNENHVSLEGVQLTNHAAVARTYVGFLIQPVTVDGSEHSTGTLGLQVSEGSPAAEAGISPGDIVLQMAACPMATRYCVPHALDGKVP
ncbi:MAG: hypothetical protein HRU15_11435, partial [Planctomycetes bacterium]|nr:hypothetical protein [Planctomycetota bacterium]